MFPEKGGRYADFQMFLALVLQVALKMPLNLLSTPDYLSVRSLGICRLSAVSVCEVAA